MRQKHITLLGKCWNCTLPKQTSNLSALHAFFLNKLKTRPRFEDEEEDLLLDSLFCCFERFREGCAMRITKRASWFDCFQLESSIVLVDLLLFLTSFTIGSINQSQSLCVILERGQIESVFSCQTNWVHPFSRSLISRLFVLFGSERQRQREKGQNKKKKEEARFLKLVLLFLLLFARSLCAFTCQIDGGGFGGGGTLDDKTFHWLSNAAKQWCDNGNYRRHFAVFGYLVTSNVCVGSVGWSESKTMNGSKIEFLNRVELVELECSNVWAICFQFVPPRRSK